MAREVVIRVIEMDECAVYARHAFEDILQTLPQIVAIPQAGALVQHDIDFHVQFVACVVSLTALNGLDRLGKPHGEIQEDVAVVGGGRGASEVFDVQGGGLGPIDDDVQAEEETAEGVEVPEFGVGADEGEDDGENVEDDVGHGVLGEGLDAAVLDEPAPEPAAELEEDGGGHDDDCGEGEVDDGVVIGGEALDALEEDLEEGGDHDDGEDEDAEGFEFAPADGVGVVVVAGDEARGGPDDGGGEEVEGGVDEGGEHGEGGGEHDDGDFADEEDRVGGEVDVDCDRDDGGGGVAFFVLAAAGEVNGFGAVGRSAVQKGSLLVRDLVDGFRGAFDFDLGYGAILCGRFNFDGGVTAVDCRCLRILGDGGWDVRGLIVGRVVSRHLVFLNQTMWQRGV